MRLNTWPGLATRCARPGEQACEHVLPGAVDAGEPQHRDRHAAALPSACHACSARSRAPPRSCAGTVAAVSSTQAPLVIAIDAERGQIDDRLQVRRGCDVAAKRRKDRIASFAAVPPRSEQMRGRRDGGTHVVRRRARHRTPSIVDAAAGFGVREVPTMRSKRDAEFGRRRSARNSRARGRAASASGVALSSAAVHSSRTAGSLFASTALAASAASRAGSSRPSAHTAAPRTSGDASSSSRSASAASDASPELPIAISTLRTKRSRPVRFTGDLVNIARKPRRRAAPGPQAAARADASRAASFASRPACAYLFQGQTARQSSQP